MSLYVTATVVKYIDIGLILTTCFVSWNIFQKKVCITHGDMCTLYRMFMTAIQYDWMLKVKGIENLSNILFCKNWKIGNSKCNTFL